MRIRNIDIPGALLKAQANGDLVVFAGAGVSMGEPSNLPSFWKLAHDIAGGVIVQEVNEPEDRFLGRLASRGINVHERACEILNMESNPTILHRAIISLFRSHNDIRVVTTNFDKHFSKILDENGFGDVKRYYAPALPLGEDFEGLVYLHGIVDDPKRIVITDQDFGRAYLTHAWATRFLQGLFQKYTVLFVGYSHKDPVMNYLARGLPPNTIRFALTPESDNYSNWELLGITPLPYPLGSEDDRHGELRDSVLSWSNVARLGALDNQQRIRCLVEGEPPVDPQDADFLKFAINDTTCVRFFCDHASSVKWLRWIEEETGFKMLFDPHITWSVVQAELANWFAKNFISNNVFEAISVIQRYGPNLNKVLWSAIASQLLFSQTAISIENFQCWVIVLLNCQESEWDIHLVNYLLEQCGQNRDFLSTLLVFDRLTKPKLELKTPFMIADGPPIRTDINYIGQDYYLRKVWKDYIGSNLSLFAVHLETILIGHIKTANYLQRGLGNATEHYDSNSWSRSSIAPHEQDRNNEPMDFLIDSVRDVLVELCRKSLNYVLDKADALLTSGIPLLKRLAVHIITESNHLSSDDKVNWLIKYKLLYSDLLKQEVFRLLKVCYPYSSFDLRNKLVNEARNGFDKTHDTDNDENGYLIVNLAAWLHQIADCDISKLYFQEMKERYPNTYVSEHPDLNHWIEDGRELFLSPVSVDDILKDNPNEIVKLLIDHSSTNYIHPRRFNLLQTFGDAVRSSFDYTWGIVENLFRLENVPSDIWTQLFLAWEQSDLQIAQLEKILGLIKQGIDAKVSDIIRFLKKYIALENGGFVDSQIPQIEELLNKYWHVIRMNDEESNQSNQEEFIIFFHPGGEIIECWIFLLMREKNSYGGLSQKYRTIFEKVLEDDDIPSLSGISRLGAYLDYLYNMNYDWTKQNIVPLFNWDLNNEIVKFAWLGYLNGGHIHLDIVSLLGDYYIQSIHNITKLIVVKRRLIDHLAYISLVGNSEINKRSWVSRTINQMTEADRGEWARTIGFYLRKMNQERIEEIWEEWIERFWRDRIQSLPDPLTQGEIDIMVTWVPYLKSVFPKAVELVLSMPEPQNASLLFHQLTNDPYYLEKWPNESSELIVHSMGRFTRFEEIKGLVLTMIGKAETRSLGRICEKMAQLGYSEAADLMDKVIRV